MAKQTYIPTVEDRVNDIRHRAALMARFFEALSQEDRGGIDKEIDREAALALENLARDIRNDARAIDRAITDGVEQAPDVDAEGGDQ